jgi:hypothetical protein
MAAGKGWLAERGEGGKEDYLQLKESIERQTRFNHHLKVYTSEYMMIDGLGYLKIVARRIHLHFLTDVKIK